LTAFIDVPVTNGQTDATFYLHGIDDTTGTVTITATVPSFYDGVTTVDVVVPCVQISSLPDSVDIAEGDVEFLTQVGIPEADSSGVLEFQAVRAGGNPKVVTITSSDSSVAEFVTTPLTDDTVYVTIPTGTYQSAATVGGGGVAFHPLSNGMTIVLAEIPGAYGGAWPFDGSLTPLAAAEPDSGPGLLGPSVPNPTSSRLTIHFTVPVATVVDLGIYNVLGQRVRSLLSRDLPAGDHTEVWDGRDDAGEELPPGMYFVRVTQGNVTESHVKWKYDDRRGLPDCPSPLFLDGHLYVIKEGGLFTAFDGESGEVVKQGRVGDPDRYFASPVAAAGRIVTASVSGQVAVVSSGPEWEVLSVHDLQEDIWSTPAIADGQVFVRTGKALYCFEDLSGE